jgi:hypothetical protein
MYHSVAGNVVYKVKPSLLLPHPPHRSYPSNRFPLLPSPPVVGKRSTEHAIFRKVNKIEIFFVFFPPIFGPVAQISVPGGQTILGQICKFHEQFEE